MNRKLLAVFGVILLAGVLFLLVLKSYTVEIVHLVVVNAVVQKAPDGYDQAKIEKVFNDALVRADQGGSRDRYLVELQEIFRSLEKRQYLEPEEMDGLLAQLNMKE